MWQSQVENVHYSVSMKIEFNTGKYASGHCLHDSQLLARLHACVTSYRSWNTAHFGLADHLILPRQQNLWCKDRDKQFAYLGYLSSVCALVKQKIAYTMPKTTMRFCSFSSHSAGIQAIACYRRGSGDGNNCLEKFCSSYLKVAKYAKITPNFKRIFLNTVKSG